MAVNGVADIFDLPEFFESRSSSIFIEDGAGRLFTYGQAWALAGRIANALAARGIRPGDRVAVVVEKSSYAIFLYLACLRSGAVFLPLNTAYTAAELDYFFGDAEPALVVCDPARRSAIDEICARLRPDIRIETLGTETDGSLPLLAAAQSADFAMSHESGDTASILYTSGTTGRSKGAMLTRANLISNALALVEAWRFSERDVLLHALPIFHAHGLFVGINTVMASGGRILLLPRFDSGEVVAMLPRATVFMGVPTFYTRLLQQPGLDADAAKGIRVFISGSAPLLAATHEAFAERTGHQILERYGMTETLMNTSNPYDGARVPGSVGLPLPGVRVRIVERETGAVLPVGETGEVELAGPNVFKGYWRNPEKTAEAFRADGYFRTGDLGVIGADGCLKLVGRSRDLIISGGYNVYPKEIENAIDAVAGVAESAVIGLPHRDFGEAVVAVVVRTAGSAVSETAILDALSARLARYKVPKQVLFLDDLPRNALGKVLKNVLRDRYAGSYGAPQRTDLPF